MRATEVTSSASDETQSRGRINGTGNYVINRSASIGKSGNDGCSKSIWLRLTTCMRHLSCSDQSDTREFQLKKLLGTGGFGRVHLAVGSSGKDIRSSVAVKLMACRRRSIADSLESEKNGLGLCHPNIVRTLAHGWISTPPDEVRTTVESCGNSLYRQRSKLNSLEPEITAAVLMEFVGGRDLQIIIDDKTEVIDFQRKIRFAYDISSALHYLHDSCSIAHLDIKPANVIVCSHDDRCKLTDFGCSIKLPSRSSLSLSSLSAIIADLPNSSSTPHSSSSSTSWSPRPKSAASASRLGYGGPLVYKAPELLKADDVTDDECRRRLHKADIYSFGVCLWQLSSRKSPYSAQYPNASPSAIVYAVVEYDARPDGSGNGPCFRRFESVTPPPSPDAVKCGNTGDIFLLSAAGVNENGYEEVYRKCWDVDVEVRPTSATLVRQFDAWIRRTPWSGRDVIVRPAMMLSVE